MSYVGPGCETCKYKINYFLAILQNIFSLQRQFFGPDDYLLYNMFNHFFFDGAEGEATFNNFLKESKGNLALVLDPPFGGKMDVLANTLKKIFKQFCDLIGKDAKISGKTKLILLGPAITHFIFQFSSYYRTSWNPKCSGNCPISR